MARIKLTDTQSYIAPPPFHTQVVDPSSGFMTLDWRRCFNQLYVRVGGAVSTTANNVEASGIENASTLTEVKESVKIVEEKADDTAKTLTELSSKVQQVIDSTNTDHESIVTLIQQYRDLKADVDTLKEDNEKNKTSISSINSQINTINDNYNSLNLRVTALENK